MRYKTFLRKILATGEVEAIAFDETHFKEAGVPASIGFGMPLLEAHQLVNKWNTNQVTQRFVYGLE